MKKVEVKMEFPLNISPDRLLSYLTIPENLENWFCDKVKILQGDLYVFDWDGSEERAVMIKNNEFDIVRFKFEEEEEKLPYSFEFRIDEDELTGDISLTIKDYQEEDDIEDTKLVWEKQVAKLRQTLGIK